MSEPPSCAQTSMRAAMGLLDEKKHQVDDGFYLDMCTLLKDAYEASPPPEPPARNKRIVLEVLIPSGRRHAVDLGIVPDIESIPLWDGKPTTPADVAEFELPLKTTTRGAYLRMMSPDMSMVDVLRKGLEGLIVRENKSSSEPLRRYLKKYHAPGILMRHSVTFSLQIDKDEGCGTFHLDVLDLQKMHFHVRGTGPFSFVLTLLPRPALVILYRKSEEPEVATGQEPAHIFCAMATTFLDFAGGG